jgi:NAD(P)-dependent dehydrogenase (short-subunit alcohol dehydrogenase family)
MAEVDVKGKTAVITGASRGIGAAIAREAHRRGMNLGLCARSEPVLPEGDSVVSTRLDVSDEPAVHAFARAVEARFGDIDLWINNAGVLEPIAFVRDVRVDDFRAHIEINLIGALIGSQAYLRHRQRVGRGGVLVNISSGAAWNPYAGWGAYCAGKAGLSRLTDCVAAEEAQNGLRAYSIAPGVVDTEMQALIRRTPVEVFPDLDKFSEMKRDGLFNSGEYVAREILAVAFDPDRATDEVDLRFPYEYEVQ